MNYQANYSIKGTLWTYYWGIPQYIQVADHQFIELQLAMHWMDLMQIAYVFAFTSWGADIDLWLVHLLVYQQQTVPTYMQLLRPIATFATMMIAGSLAMLW